ncbi:hypothetical protein C6Y45_00545 [Alkalicoccus saliphilus]|uniref:Uncharacterized protein n=1 Tax=Alkalicoccus saliphilus TaxID=200989 RepID=A0A2T4UAM9_9BACI|nr:hypothetical protein C6Y45_00545 [Alkalicoccus saliphilus]
MWLIYIFEVTVCVLSPNLLLTAAGFRFVFASLKKKSTAFHERCSLFVKPMPGQRHLRNHAAPPGRKDRSMLSPLQV